MRRRPLYSHGHRVHREQRGQTKIHPLSQLNCYQHLGFDYGDYEMAHQDLMGLYFVLEKIHKRIHSKKHD
ncbi:MAG: hypothetical protein A2V81_05000 [Candidatus Abawacabacteria bacterium RBG_16_42_10]|uniref:Uncharacterized protein n=1 Tax=Candidatus Abawacabacteria bacterium RBG_16_42_10 TaxID=1817814 RepID=A0A1F4XKI9_9BACT|nr:MAG: hypothetical protein A2V81_05000 [Candidatus Abawacabacteria bacterium RBG_16_42_10]